jgi:U4/U6.U5 tri-snRNP component SNU23
MGQTTKLERSTVEQVRARIALLRERTKEAAAARTFDFDQRLSALKAQEAALREEKKAQKKARSQQARMQLATESESIDDMSKLMGFGSFGSSKK